MAGLKLRVSRNIFLRGLLILSHFFGISKSSPKSRWLSEIVWQHHSNLDSTIDNDHYYGTLTVAPLLSLKLKLFKS
jgi:hypothetical protein